MEASKFVSLFLSLLLLAFSSFAVASDRRIAIDSFENGLNPKWEAKLFKGETSYVVVPEAGGHILKAESDDSASGLVFRIVYDLEDYPILTWRWKVENIIEKGDARYKEGDDYAARVYVVFPHWLPFLSRSINYIWANRLPEGQYIPNSYFSRAVMIAVRSGRENLGVWLLERRNVYQDYRMVFGESPSLVGAIAIMTDTDNTAERAIAYYDDIAIEKGEPASAP